MREIKRDIVSAIIISKDQKILFGMTDPNRGGVYSDCWHLPGGGVDQCETKEQALIREVKEEIGIDISPYDINLVDDNDSGEAEKVLKDTEEKVLCKMKFHVYKIIIHDHFADEIEIFLNDDLVNYGWFNFSDLKKIKLTPPSKKLFNNIDLKNMTNNLRIELKDLIERKFANDEVSLKYLEKISKDDGLTKKENELSHMCTYFAPYDPVAKQIFIGHHKKSGLWLVNGGHIDPNETLKETLKREIEEEWGLNIDDFEISEPDLLTICPINNPEKQKCLEHFDIWHFIKVDKNNFHPNQEKLAEEFHETRWVTFEEAMNLNTDDNQRKGFNFVKDNFFKENQ